jgi:hypothetical protein
MIVVTKDIEILDSIAVEGKLRSAKGLVSR